MKSLITVVLATVGFALTAAPVPAHVHYTHGKPQTECTAYHTPQEYRKFASKVYERDRISVKAHVKLHQLHNCQWTFKGRVKVGRLHTKLLAKREQGQCSNSNPRACAYDAGEKFGVDPQRLINCALSEGGLGPQDYKKMNYGGSGAGGNWQFMSGTLYGNAPSAGIRNPTWLNSHDQAYTAAWMFAHGQSGQWTGAGCN